MRTRCYKEPKDIDNRYIKFVKISKKGIIAILVQDSPDSRFKVITYSSRRRKATANWQGESLHIILNISKTAMHA